MKKKMISLFSCAGGLDWGFHKSNNYKLIISNEINQSNLKTYTNHYNIPLLDISEYSNQFNVGICGDINKLDIHDSTDIIVGGPPCQDFSILRGKNKRLGSQSNRGKLYKQYLRILKKTSPTIFVFENVEGILSANNRTTYKKLLKDFSDLNYSLIFNEIVNIADLGAPQSRKRLIIIGMKKDAIFDANNIQKTIYKYLSNDILKKYPLTPIEVFEGEVLTNLNKSYIETLQSYENCFEGIHNDFSEKWKVEFNKLSFNIKKDYIASNKIICSCKKEFKKAMNLHEKILKILGYYKKDIDLQTFEDKTNLKSKTQNRIIERMNHIPPSYNYLAVKDTKWEVKGLMSNVYKRIHPLIPSPTVIAYGGGGTGGYHYKINRQGLTNRERARLQTFPDDYLFNGTIAEIRAQIGEAVPPIASYWIEKSITEILNNV